MFSKWLNVGLNMAVRWPFDFDFVFAIVTDQCYYGKEEICKVSQQNINRFAILEIGVRKYDLLECLFLKKSCFNCNFYLKIAYLYVEAMRDRKRIQLD